VRFELNKEDLILEEKKEEALRQQSNNNSVLTNEQTDNDSQIKSPRNSSIN